MCLRTELCPRECFMVGLIDLLQTKDTGEIFSEPVDQTEVLDYGDVVKQPMDLSTMRFKVSFIFIFIVSSQIYLLRLLHNSL